MGFRRYAFLYVPVAVGAIYLLVNSFVLAPQTETADVQSTGIFGAHPLAEGEMKKLSFHATPKPASQVPFNDPEGDEHNLADYKGKYILVNIWATWCPPCRKEMPSINRLQQQLGGENFEVVTIATGRNTLPGIRKFFDKAGITDLPILLDPTQGLARSMGILGLPVTVIIDPQGQEIARLTGDAEWDTQSALAIIKTLIAP
ncbi:MAG TPA: thioredoxin [Rhodobacteraceae bacterium]|nr:thioredoxin [Paracoccaceae bacterium]